MIRAELQRRQSADAPPPGKKIFPIKQTG